jgi:hypothetical protein
MGKGGIEAEESRQPVLTLDFEDGSRFELPKDWEDAFHDRFGLNPQVIPQVGDRVRFIAGKYIAHEAWPSKYDKGLLDPDGMIEDEDLDNPRFYKEHWRSWGAEGKKWGAIRGKEVLTNPPSQADVAAGVVYKFLRVSLLQKVAFEIAEADGATPIQVFSIGGFSREMTAQGLLDD